MSNAIVEVVPYDPRWPDIFEKEAQLIRNILGDNCVDMHHIGSTSVHGLKAKPIIDIIPVVKDILKVDHVVSEFENLGYDAKGEHGIPFRRYFTKGKDVRSHNLHIFEQGNPEIEKHLKFRDWMDKNPDDREAYSALKSALALNFSHDMMGYCFGKSDFIADIMAKTDFDGLHIAVALTNREWEAVRHFRQKYFFDRVPIDDPYTWTFQHPQHVHFVLYKGALIIGYTHIQLWPQNRAAMRIIVIDEPHRNAGIGSEFLKLCERWLSHKNIKKLHVQASPDAYNFYCKNKYIKMPFDDPDSYEGDPSDIEMGKNLN